MPLKSVHPVYPHIFTLVQSISLPSKVSCFECNLSPPKFTLKYNFQNDLLKWWCLWEVFGSWGTTWRD
jgi:hypothetical protein